MPVSRSSECILSWPQWLVAAFDRHHHHYHIALVWPSYKLGHLKIKVKNNDYTVSQKTLIFIFLNNSVKNEPKVVTCPPHPHTVATLPGECQKSHFSAAACWDLGWTAAKRRGWGHWAMAETNGSVYPCTGWSLWTLFVALLPFILPHNTTSFFQSHQLSSRKTMYFRTYELLYFSQGIA